MLPQHLWASSLKAGSSLDEKLRKHTNKNDSTICTGKCSKAEELGQRARWATESWAVPLWGSAREQFRYGPGSLEVVLAGLVQMGRRRMRRRVRKDMPGELGRLRWHRASESEGVPIVFLIAW